MLLTISKVYLPAGNMKLYNINVKERSKNYNRRTERAVQDAGTIIQPAGRRMYYWRQAGEGEGQHMLRVLCIKRQIQI